jgi:hypothetical protein
VCRGGSREAARSHHSDQVLLRETERHRQVGRSDVGHHLRIGVQKIHGLEREQALVERLDELVETDARRLHCDDGTDALDIARSKGAVLGWLQEASCGELVDRLGIDADRVRELVT